MTSDVREPGSAAWRCALEGHQTAPTLPRSAVPWKTESQRGRGARALAELRENPRNA
jgi:hypothetical protein